MPSPDSDSWWNKIGGLIKKKAPLEEQLIGMIDPADPRVLIRPLGGDWLCPFTATTIAVPNWDGCGETLLEHAEVTAHLLSLPQLQAKGQHAPMKRFDELCDIAINMRLRKAPNYRQCSDTGDWICPYCLRRTSVLLTQWDRTEEPPEIFIPQAYGHWKFCEMFKSGPLAAKTVDEIRASFGNEALRMDLLKRVASDPAFNVYDDAGSWICPFSVHSIEAIKAPSLTGRDVDKEAIVRHLMDPAQCPAHYSKWVVEVKLDELHRIAGRMAEQRMQAHNKKAAEQELANLREHVAQTSNTVTEMRRDLEAARQTQVKMLPNLPPKIEGYDIASYYESCAELSGDLYHFFDAGPGRTGILIGDVSGHGVEAAMVMSATLKSFSVRSKGQASPRTVMKAVNSDLHKDLRRGKFVTAFYAVLEHDTGHMRYCRAGHNPAFLIAGNGLEKLMGNGLALGITDDQKFGATLTEGEITLPPHALVLLYTDGIAEAMNADKDEFGEERMCDLFLQYAYLPSVNIIEQLQAAVQEHVGGQEIADDMTLVLIKRV